MCGMVHEVLYNSMGIHAWSVAKVDALCGCRAGLVYSGACQCAIIDVGVRVGSQCGVCHLSRSKSLPPDGAHREVESIRTLLSLLTICRLHDAQLLMCGCR